MRTNQKPNPDSSAAGILSIFYYIKSVLPLLAVAIPTLLLDRITKWLVQHYIPWGTGYSVIPGFFNLRHDTNTGAAFGILSGQRALLIGVTIVALVFIFIYYFQFRHSRWMRIALGFLLGGAVGNFIDRLYLGRVIDFLQFGIESKHLFWPTFNVADVSVCIGAGMLIFYLFRYRNQSNTAV